MKKLANIILLSVIICATASAQPSHKNCNGGHFQKIESEKIAYYTQAMDLTPEEAKAFWPVYDAIEKDQRQLNKKEGKAFMALQGAIHEGKGDEEISKLLEEYLSAKSANVNLHAANIERYKAVLPPSKVARLFTAQESFRRQMFNNLKKR